MTAEEFGRSYQKLHHRTVRFLRGRGLNLDQSKEHAQAGWARGFERLKDLRNDGMLLTWINSISWNIYLSALRRKKNVTFVAINPDELSGDLNGSIEIEIDFQRVLGFAVPKERALIELKRSGKADGEIARQQGVTETAIRIRLLRARQNIRRRIKKRESAESK